MKTPQWFWDFMRRRTYPMPFTGWDYYDVVQISWKAYQKGKRDREVCEWEYIDTEKCFAFEESYKTKCGDIFVVASIADYTYCPVCGKRIKVKGG